MCGGGGGAKISIPESARIQAAWGKSMRTRANSAAYKANEAALDEESRKDRSEYLNARSSADVAIATEDAHELAATNPLAMDEASYALAEEATRIEMGNETVAEGIKLDGTVNRLGRATDQGSRVSEGLNFATSIGMSKERADARAKDTIQEGKSAAIRGLASAGVQMYGAESAYQRELAKGGNPSLTREDFFKDLNPYAY